VKEMVRRCLLEMEMRKLKTVAFPAFGTGKLGYPKRETAKAMFDAVEEYQYSCIKSSVESVVFALHVRDIDTCDVCIL
jgi:O-acetyl-ADP-ribose deacetylase (regulator of RNase III)